MSDAWGVALSYPIMRPSKKKRQQCHALWNERKKDRKERLSALAAAVAPSSSAEK